MKKTIAALAVAAVVLGGVGFVAASQTASAEEATVQTASDTVRPLGPITEVLDELVADGTITADQAQAITDALASRLPAGPRMGERPGAGPMQEGLESVADALGMTTDEVRTALVGGESIADLAEAQGIDVDTLVATLTAEAQSHLTQAVADGRISQERADEISQTIAERIDAMVNGEMPHPFMDGRQGVRGDRMGGEHRPGGPMGGGFGPGAGA